MRRTPALIVGGGPAGATAAMTLARYGAAHLLVERTLRPHDALCGGFLSWRTLELLDGLGIERDALNRHDITKVRMFAGAAVAEADLPQPAKAVSRRRLDAMLLDAAIEAGAAVERGVTVRAIEGTSARLDDGSSIGCEALFLASGKHDIRGATRDPRPSVDPTLGLRVRLVATPRLTRCVGGAVELHLFDRGYAGLVLQEDGSANLCLAVHRSRLHEAGDPARLLVAIANEAGPLGERLAALDPALPIDAVANVPYGWRARTARPGTFRLGDQAGVIPSLAGEGMGIALASGIAAANAYLSGGAAATTRWQPAFGRALARPIGIANRVWQFAEHPIGARGLVALARAAPLLIEIIARATRIGQRGLDAIPAQPEI